MDSSTPPLQRRHIPRSEHSVSRAQISPNALKVLYRLRAAGFRACLVGGGVRDLLLGREPKDFDVATDAHPEDVYRLFRNCRLIGRRFRLAHVRFGPEIIEVATFRGLQAPVSDGDDDDEQGGQVAGPHLDSEGRIISDNVYGTIEADAVRRDFTVNALYYDIEDFSILDYAGGMEDLEKGLIRLIGDPQTRYREDPVRMLRAVRFAARLGFRIEHDTEEAILRLGDLLRAIPPARLFEEILKLLMAGLAAGTFELLRQYGLFEHLFPATEQCLNEDLDGDARRLLVRALEGTDARIADGKPVTPYFLYAALLWGPYRAKIRALGPDTPGAEQLEALADAVVREQAAHTALPKRFSIPMREIWALQPRLEQLSGRRAEKLLTQPRFRAAYDFLLLRAQSGEPLQGQADMWTDLQSAGVDMAAAEAGTEDRRRRPRRRRRRPVHIETS